MPRPPAPRTCGTPGCPQYTAGQPHCDEHQPAAWATSHRRDELPPNWKTIAAQIKQRDGNRCVLCGNTHRLEVDHRGDRHDHTAANLRTLCHECHAAHTHSQSLAARRA